MKKLNLKNCIAQKKKNKKNQRHQLNLIFCSKPSQSVTVFFSCVPPDPNQCHRNEITCAYGPSALKERQIFANLTLIGVRGMKIIMKVHQKMGRVSRPVFHIKWHWMGSGGKHIRKHIQVRSVVKRSCPILRDAIFFIFILSFFRLDFPFSPQR